MSELLEASPVKLFTGLILSKHSPYEQCILKLEERIGRADFISEKFPFQYTNYYRKEMGNDLSRIIISYKQLIKRDQLVKIKIIAVELEHEFLFKGKRKINIDPGYIAPEHLILATGKGYSHRPYLGKGVYADLTLVYSNREFKSLEWTYPDYRTDKMKELFKGLREKYMLQLAEEEIP
ncbi:DUF4416 family protein [Desulfobacterota bacterium AH_259_B03_O07]|nr:DUF4416 family protein [Desulfobacterota bacterium AH_259_B03_O07]